MMKDEVLKAGVSVITNVGLLVKILTYMFKS